MSTHSIVIYDDESRAREYLNHELNAGKAAEISGPYDTLTILDEPANAPQLYFKQKEVWVVRVDH